jgi:hypothetical protein
MRHDVVQIARAVKNGTSLPYTILRAATSPSRSYLNKSFPQLLAESERLHSAVTDSETH